MEYFVCADKWFIIQFEEEIDIANNEAHDLSEEGDLKIKHHLQKIVNTRCCGQQRFSNKHSTDCQK